MLLLPAFPFLLSKLFDNHHSQNHLPPSISPHVFPEHSSCTFSFPVLRFLVYLLHSSFLHSTFRSLFLSSSHLLSCLPRNSYYNVQSYEYPHLDVPKASVQVHHKLC